MSPSVGLDGRMVQPKTQRGKRELQQREPKLVENAKEALFVRGHKTGLMLNQLLKDLYALRKPLATMLQRSNDVLPFEDDTFLEKMCRKYDSSLFCFANHNKKRPNNLIFGRMYDFHTLDMIETGVTNYKSIKSLRKGGTVPMGTKPCIVFSGDAFGTDANMIRLKNLLLDLLRGDQPDSVRLQGLQLLVQVTALADGTVAVRTYRIDLKKSGGRTPRCELSEMGPSFDLTVRRHKIASEELYKTACKVPKQAVIRPVKNVSRDVFGTRHGRIHLPRQDLKQLSTRKLKALKSTPQEGDRGATRGQGSRGVTDRRGVKRARTE